MNRVKERKMETAEELANEKYYDIPYPKNIASVDDYTTNEIRLLQRIAYVAGYNEAMRWRDPKVELPESQEIVLVKSDNGCYATAYCHGASGCFIDYGSDAYVDFGEIIAWRPIE